MANQEIRPRKTPATFKFVYCTLQKAKSYDTYSSILIEVMNLTDTIPKI